MSSNFVVSAALFLLALLPRVVAPDRFLTPDEFLWVDRSRNFLAGLLNETFRCTTVVETWAFAEGLACTLRTGHPGVTTMWTGSFGLWLSWLPASRYLSLYDYVVGVSTNPLDISLLAPARIGTILITSLWVVAVYWLSRRLFGPQIALVGAVLIALSPFHIALSRVIHHDALSTTFMTLSALAALIYWGEKGEKKWLLVSGGLAGFGFLSKSPALYLMPFIALIGLWFAAIDIKQARGGGLAGARAAGWLSTARGVLARTVLDGLLWFAVAALVVFIFWPAMWAVPKEALETVFFIGSKYATGGHAKGNFFLGEISQDPGPLFYPVTWLYRVTPLALVGVIAALAIWGWQKLRSLAGRQQETLADSPAPERGFLFYVPLMLLFVAGYYLLMTIGEKKQDRYFLPVYPWLDFIAAGGLVSIINYQLVINNWRSVGHHIRLGLLVLAVVALHGYFIFVHAPYYFTYYNPLFGGIKGAAEVMTIGWGEGLDLAAEFLNQRQGREPSRVASWYESTFAPYYYGSTISYSKEKGKALAGDYVVFYINQTQRRFPDDIFFEYFESRFKPVEVIELHGVDYAWIYPSLGIDHYIQDQTYTGIAALLAWQWSAGDRPLTPGQAAPFELYWEYLGKQPEEPFFFRLVDAQNRAWAEALSQPQDNPPREQWREGEIIYETGALTVPAGTPPGRYQLQIGFYTNAPAVASGELQFIIPPDESLVTVGHANQDPAAFSLPDQAVEHGQPLGDALTLLGAALPPEPVAAGSNFPLQLYWQVNRALAADANLHVGLMDEVGQARQGWFNLSLAELFEPDQTTWQPGDIIRTRWQLDLLPDIPPGAYRLELVLPEDTSQVLPAGVLEVQEQLP